jgi:hypothetical protein
MGAVAGWSQRMKTREAVALVEGSVSGRVVMAVWIIL